jgi:hypothetical protein
MGIWASGIDTTSIDLSKILVESWLGCALSLKNTKNLNDVKNIKGNLLESSWLFWVDQHFILEKRISSENELSFTLPLKRNN